MKYGLVLSNVGGCGDPSLLADLAREAEQAGWDGVFLFDSILSPTWDSFFPNDPEKRTVADPWIALAAMAMRTERIRIGTMATPVTRRRPWKLARETVTLDHLSNGRLILPVALGAVDDGGFANVGEELDRKVRAQRLDESLEILAGLWSGQPFNFHGEHFQVEEMTFLPTPVQSPRIPIWVVGAWPRKRSMLRTLRWDGVCPVRMHDDGSFGELSPGDVREIKAFADAHRSAKTPFDIVIEGESSGSEPERAAARVGPYAEAGATWWLESAWTRLLKPPQDIERLWRRIRAGPPPLRAP